MTTKSCYYAGVLGSGMRISAQNLANEISPPQKIALLLLAPRNIDPLAMVFLVLGMPK
jgi:hypothetical protein